MAYSERATNSEVMRTAVAVFDLGLKLDYIGFFVITKKVRLDIDGERNRFGSRKMFLILYTSLSLY